MKVEGGSSVMWKRIAQFTVLAWSVQAAWATLEEVGAWEQLMSSGTDLYRSGDYTAAREKFNESLVLAKSFSRSDPRRVHTWNSLCNITQEFGRPEEAEKYCLSALREQTSDHVSPLVRLNNVNTLHLLIAIHLQMGRVRSAKEFLKQYEEELRNMGPAPPAKLIGILHYDRAFLDLLAGKLDAAERGFLRARDTFGTEQEHAKVLATTLSHLGSIAYRRKRHAEAENYTHQSITAVTAIHGPNHPDIARDLHNLALIYLQTGRATEAEPVVSRALHLIRSMYGEEADLMVTMSATYAKVLDKLGRKPEAKAMRRKAEMIARNLELQRPGRYVVDVQSLAPSYQR
jgi:tetratricopeptide (TPR) repeat protein